MSKILSLITSGVTGVLSVYSGPSILESGEIGLRSSSGVSSPIPGINSTKSLVIINFDIMLKRDSHAYNMQQHHGRYCY